MRALLSRRPGGHRALPATTVVDAIARLSARDARGKVVVMIE